MNMVTVRMEQGITDVVPRPFGPGPRAKELYRETVRLGPPSVALERSVQPPAQVLFPLLTGDASAS